MDNERKENIPYSEYEQLQDAWVKIAQLETKLEAADDEIKALKLSITVKLERANKAEAKIKAISVEIAGWEGYHCESHKLVRRLRKMFPELQALIKCEHDKGSTEYCLPCGRVNGGE